MCFNETARYVTATRTRVGPVFTAGSHSTIQHTLSHMEEAIISHSEDCRPGYKVQHMINETSGLTEAFINQENTDINSCSIQQCTRAA